MAKRCARGFLEHVRRRDRAVRVNRGEHAMQ
jgi:hypothetical protein